MFLAMDSFATETGQKKSSLIMMGEGVCGGLYAFWNWACYYQSKIHFFNNDLKK